MERKESALKAVAVLHENVPGHRNQSLGVAEALQKEVGAVIREFEVPNFRGLKRLFKVKSKLSRLPELKPEELEKWLTQAGGAPLKEEIAEWLKEISVKPSELLLLSAGSRVAPYNFGLGKILLCRTGTLMTPKYLGTTPFDFSMIPSHDQGDERANQLVTLGAPNRIQKEILAEKAGDIVREFPGKGQKKWVLLIGGESSTFRIGPDWAKNKLPGIIEKAEAQEADLYVATSRRTRKDTELVIRDLLSQSSATRMIWLASERPENPVPGLLGMADRVYCTEDSISMVSESLTAGKAVFLLKTDYIRGPKEKFKKWGISLGLINSRAAWKPDRFKILYDEFRKKGWLYDEGEEPAAMPIIEFHESRRAAKWITENWR